MLLTFMGDPFSDAAEDVNEATKTYFYKVIGALDRRGLINVEFFEGLRKERPMKTSEIKVLEKLCLDQAQSVTGLFRTTHLLGETTWQPTVYLARPTTDLDEKYGEVRQYLQQAGVRVLSAPPNPEDPTGERESADQNIAAATLFVELLGDGPNPSTANLPHGVSDLEHEVARGLEKPILQWLDVPPRSHESADPDQRDRLAEATVYAEGIEEFKARIVREVKAPRPPAGAPDEECQVFITADWPDRAVAKEIATALKENHGPLALRDWSLPPREYRACLYRKLEVCHTVLVVCRDCPDSWIKAQFADILKVGVRRAVPAVKRLIDARPPDRKGPVPPLPADTLVLDCRGGLDPGAIRRWLFAERQEAST
jgi:hypothetical protein